MRLYNYKIVREKTEVYYDGRKSLTSPYSIYEVLKEYYEQNFDMDKEHFSIIMLDTKNKVIGVNLVSMGTLNQTLTHPREIFRPAIMAAANSIFLCHNHPSGNSTPSVEDVSITKRLTEAGQLLGIQVLDHIILGNDNFTSLRQENYM